MCVRLGGTLSFNPRSREGATTTRDPYIDDSGVSIRAPVKERPVKGAKLTRQIGFNPRSREGATQMDTI